MKTILIAIALLIFTASAHAARPAPNAVELKPKLYTVVFAVTSDSNGKVASLSVARVADPASQTTKPVPIKVPAVYLSAVRKALLKKTYPPPAGKIFYIYTFYDPQHPHRPDNDPVAFLRLQKNKPRPPYDVQ